MQKTLSSSRVHPNMVRRVDVAPRPINPMGLPARSITIDDDDVITRSAVRSHSIEYQEHSALRSRAIEHTSAVDSPITQHEVGFGGFPGPRELFARSSRALFPSLYRGLHRTLTIPRTSTLVPQNDRHVPVSDEAARMVEYLSFVANVKNNSQFQGLTEEQIMELGGVEYRALTVLLWIVPIVSLLKFSPDICDNSCSIIVACSPSPSPSSRLT